MTTEAGETSSLISADSLLEDVKVSFPADDDETTPDISPPSSQGLDAAVSTAKSVVTALGAHATKASLKVGETTKALTGHLTTNAGPTAAKVGEWTTTTYGSISTKAVEAADQTRAFTVKAADQTRALTMKAADQTKGFTAKAAGNTRDLALKTIETTKERAGPIMAKVKTESDLVGGRVMEFVATHTKDLTVTQILCLVQGILLVFFLVGTSYDTSTYNVKEYIAFRDIMAMLLLGFGYLMTFLKKYGLGAVGFTMMLSVLAMELNIMVEWIVGGASWPLQIGMSTLIDAEFAAATLMISFGALIGRTSPLQMLIVCILQSVFYAVNKVWFVFGFIGAEDVGGSMTIHMFGAYFGLAVSYALGAPKDVEATETATPDRVSDVLALIGTTILWVFWPSFVGATETAVEANERNCVINTIVALLASTTMTFFLSQYLSGAKFDPVHIANSTLAGGVAIGCLGRLNIGLGVAMVVGGLAGAASVFGYVHSSQHLETKYSIFDTCGVGNLHGYPSLVGAVLSVVLVAFHTDADFIVHSAFSQMMRQLFGIVFTLVHAIGAGYVTGLVAKLKNTSIATYHDGLWWHTEYYPAMNGTKTCEENGYMSIKDVEEAGENVAVPATTEPPAETSTAPAPTTTTEDIGIRV